MLKISGLARKVQDTTVLKSAWNRIVQNDIAAGVLDKNKTDLDRRVATRWNSDLACLKAHLYFRVQITKLIAEERSLSRFALTDAQWKLAYELADVLEVHCIPLLLSCTLLIILPL